MEKLREYAQILVNAVPDTAENANCIELLNKGVEAIVTVNEKRKRKYNFVARWSKIFHALSIHSIRPNPTSAAELDKIMEEIVPDNLDPEGSLGLPIRASDKYNYESECLNFSDNMTVMSELWHHQMNEMRGNRQPTIVITTESKSMMEEQQAWVKTKRHESISSFGFQFMTNSHDILPSSGFIKDVVRRDEGRDSDPDANMLSSVSSLKAQLFPRISVGNCGSNFHAMLHDLLLEGCGAARDNSFMCIQEHKDPLLRPCCGWDKKCVADKEAYRRKLQQPTRLNSTDA